MPYHCYEPKALDQCVTDIQNEKGNHHHFIRKKRVFSSWAQLYRITFSISKDFCYLLASIRTVFRVFRQIRIYTLLSYDFSKFLFLVSELASGLHSIFVTFSFKVSIK